MSQQVGFGPETQALINAMQGQETASSEPEVSQEGTPEAEEVDLEAGEAEDNTPQESAPAENAEGEEEIAVEESTEPKSKANVEKIWVDDGTGRKQVELDYSDKAAVKKYAEMAFGMRKFQRERDQLKKWREENESKLTELSEAWGAVENTYKKDGIKGLVNLLVGEDNAYDAHVNKIIEEAKFKENASPDELARWEAAQEAEKIRRENEEIRKELAKEREEQLKSKEQAELQSLQQKLNPAYAKHSFDGKLGDPELEEQYNTALWQLSINKLKSLPETEELTPSVINSTFQEVASRFNKAVTTQAKKKVAKTVQKKKDAASTKAAAMANAGVRQSAVADEFKQHIKSGNIVESMKMFMSGKVKLK